MSQRNSLLVPKFKYTDEEDRKQWIEHIYPISEYLLHVVKQIEWERFHLNYFIYGGSALEIYNNQYKALTEKKGFSLHSYVDPTADIDVEVCSNNDSDSFDTLFDDICIKLQENIIPIEKYSNFTVKPTRDDLEKTEALYYGTPFTVVKSKQIHNFVVQYIRADHERKGIDLRIQINIRINDTYKDHCVEFLLNNKKCSEEKRFFTEKILGYTLINIFSELKNCMDVISNGDSYNSKPPFSYKFKKIPHYITRSIYLFFLIIVLFEEPLQLKQFKEQHETIQEIFNSIIFNIEFILSNKGKTKGESVFGLWEHIGPPEEEMFEYVKTCLQFLFRNLRFNEVVSLILYRAYKNIQKRFREQMEESKVYLSQRYREQIEFLENYYTRGGASGGRRRSKKTNKKLKLFKKSKKKSNSPFKKHKGIHH